MSGKEVQASKEAQDLMTQVSPPSLFTGTPAPLQGILDYSMLAPPV